MKKHKIVLASIMMIIMMTGMVYAADMRREIYDSNGGKVAIIRFNSSSSNGMKWAFAITSPQNRGKYSSTTLVTYYDDGSENVIYKPFTLGVTSCETGYEWSEDHRATHKVWSGLENNSYTLLVDETW